MSWVFFIGLGVFAGGVVLLVYDAWKQRRCKYCKGKLYLWSWKKAVCTVCGRDQ